MTDGQTCVAVCSGSARVEGTIKCKSGRLIDTSYCIAGPGFTSEKVVKVFGTLDVVVTGDLTVASLTISVAFAFGIDRQYIFIFFGSLSGRGGRLLSAHQSPPLRFLTSNINVGYEVIVPPNVTQRSIVSAATALSEPTSTVAKSFAQSMSSSGVKVVSVAHVDHPIAVQSITVTDPTGAPIKPGQAAPALPPNEEADLNIQTMIGAIVGGVVVGIIALLIFGVLVHRAFLKPKLHFDNPKTPTFSC